MPEMLVEGLSKEIQRDDSGLRPGLQNHNGRPSRSRTDIKDAATSRREEGLRRKLGGGIQGHLETNDQECGSGPNHNNGEQHAQPCRPSPAYREYEQKSCDRRDYEVTVR